MAIDSVQKRMSAMNPSSPWRGPLVDATESGFTAGNRQAADFMYSGIAAQTSIPLTEPDEIGMSVPTFTDTSFTVPQFTDVSLGIATFTDISLTVAETQGMLHILEQDQIWEETTGDFDAIVRDEDGAAIAQASLTTITLTLRNYKTGEIINSRNAQSVNNTNNVTIDSSGNLLWLIQEEDTVIFDESLEFGDKEEHVAEFVYTYSSGTKTGRVYYTFEVIRKMKSLV